jgi:hypothetical protein
MVFGLSYLLKSLDRDILAQISVLNTHLMVGLPFEDLFSAQSKAKITMLCGTIANNTNKHA